MVDSFERSTCRKFVVTVRVKWKSKTTFHMRTSNVLTVYGRFHRVCLKKVLVRVVNCNVEVYQNQEVYVKKVLNENQTNQLINVSEMNNRSF